MGGVVSKPQRWFFVQASSRRLACSESLPKKETKREQKHNQTGWEKRKKKWIACTHAHVKSMKPKFYSLIQKKYERVAVSVFF